MADYFNSSNFFNSSSSNTSSDGELQQTIKPYYGGPLGEYNLCYAAVHGYLSLAVCIFGITSNVLNIIVLTRKNMESPTNSILTGLAVADMLVMISYFPFAVHNYIRTGLSQEEKYSYGWAVFALIHAHFTVVNHTISSWLTVTVAIWRFMSVCYPTSTMRWRGLLAARTAVLSTYVTCTAFCIPLYMSFTVREHTDKGVATYKVGFSIVAQKNDLLLATINFWLFSVLAKIVPCILLTILSVQLLRVLYQANLRRRRLKLASECDKSRDRTTKMLLAVLFLFLLTEFPSGVLALLSGALGEDFFTNVYLNFGETMDILALVNSAVNFIIYCSMSRQFRDTFAYLFFPKVKGKWAAIPHVPPTEHTQTVGTACV